MLLCDNNCLALLICRPPPCSNGPAVIFMCHTLRFRAISSGIILLYHFVSSLMLSSHFSSTSPSLYLYLHRCHHYSSSLSRDHTITVVLSEEAYHWFNVVFPPDVVILHVVLICLDSSSPSQHSDLSGLPFICIFSLNAQHYFDIITMLTNIQQPLAVLSERIHSSPGCKHIQGPMLHIGCAGTETNDIAYKENGFR